MSDLVKRLRKQADEILDPGYPYYGTPELVREAADEIERLQAVMDAAEQEIARIREECLDNYNRSGFEEGELDAVEQVQRAISEAKRRALDGEVKP